MLFITCALHCEAKPLIARYKLVADREAAFPVFKNETLVLVVTGVGKLLTASAMSYVYARYNEPAYAAWLNVGVVGVKTTAVGELLNINKITEKSTGTNWYPVRLASLPTGLSYSLITLDKPSNNYTDNDAYDMEASAFMATALRYSPVELVQIVKVVSDNESESIHDVNKNQVAALILKQVVYITSVVEELQKNINLFLEYYNAPDLYEQCVATWRFSAYQKNQLSRILNQWLALDGTANINMLEDCVSGKQVIDFVGKKLSVLEINFND